jgi:hypothetical protein
MSTMSRPISGGVTAIGGVCALVIGLAAIDGRVREQLMQLASGRAPSGELVTAGERVQDLVLTMLQVVRDQSIEHAALTIFALGALVLVLVMLRT